VDQLTQAILAKAFRGELVPQDPNDEPAAVLLEKIHALKTQRQERLRREKNIVQNSRKSRKSNRSISTKH